jgi:hypothetical protein
LVDIGVGVLGALGVSAGCEGTVKVGVAPAGGVVGVAVGLVDRDAVGVLVAVAWAAIVVAVGVFVPAGCVPTAVAVGVLVGVCWVAIEVAV